MEELLATRRQRLFEGFSLISLLILCLVIAVTSLATETSLLMVLFGFAPTLITIIVCIILYEEASHKMMLVWFTPFVLTAAFFLIGTSESLLSSRLDVKTLTGVNLFLSIVYLVVFFMLFSLIKNRPQKKARRLVPGNQSEVPDNAEHRITIVHEAKPQTIRQYVTSMEDKSKALNFAIGRVYSKFHGGTKQMRSEISIPASWYNEFSEAHEGQDNAKLMGIANKIESRLKLLELKESEVFSEYVSKLKNLKRNHDGTSRILDVLKENDKDPVESYYDGAIELCGKLRSELLNLR